MSVSFVSSSFLQIKGDAQAYGKQVDAEIRGIKGTFAYIYLVRRLPGFAKVETQYAYADLYCRIVVDECNHSRSYADVEVGRSGIGSRNVFARTLTTLDWLPPICSCMSQ